MNKCLNCGKEVKNKYCNSKCRNQHKPTIYVPTQDSIDKQKDAISKKWKFFSVKCYKCGKDFEIKEFNVEKPKKEKYYCSRSCANSHIFTNETKQKISDKNKNQIPWNKGIMIENGKIIKGNNKIIKKCPVCKKEFEVYFHKSNKIYCSKNCYLKDNNCSFRKKSSGGLRKGSGRGKYGWYKGFWSDSSWELAWIIYNIDHNVIFERNHKGFEYYFNNKKYNFYPDFIVNGNFYEIKGYIDSKNKSKIKQFSDELIIIDKTGIKPYIEYVIKKYGKNYIELYEENPYKIKNKKCLICGSECVNMYCSQFCAGKGVSLLKKK